MDKYRLDLVVANRLENIDVKSRSQELDRHEALFVGSGGQVLARFSTKHDIAASLADFIIERGFTRI